MTTATLSLLGNSSTMPQSLEVQVDVRRLPGRCTDLDIYGKHETLALRY